MPLLNVNPTSQINKVSTLLEKANLGKLVEQESKKGIKQKLLEADLDTADVLDIIGQIARGGDSDATRLRAAEMVLKLSGDLREEEKPMPIVNIVINDPESKGIEINPILIPR